MSISFEAYFRHFILTNYLADSHELTRARVASSAGILWYLPKIG